jgi:hypothetical protein
VGHHILILALCRHQSAIGVFSATHESRACIFRKTQTPLMSFHVWRPMTKPSTQLASTMHAYVMYKPKSSWRAHTSK